MKSEGSCCTSSRPALPLRAGRSPRPVEHPHHRSRPRAQPCPARRPCCPFMSAQRRARRWKSLHSRTAAIWEGAHERSAPRPEARIPRASSCPDRISPAPCKARLERPTIRSQRSCWDRQPGGSGRARGKRFQTRLTHPADTRSARFREGPREMRWALRIA
jgi:hypothetical protein